MELKKYPVDKTNTSRIEFIRLDNRLLDLKNIRVLGNKHYDTLLKISKDAYYLLQNDLSNVCKDTILEKYKNLLYERGLTISSKRVKQRELYEEFISFYGTEFLELMESSIDNDDEYNWLRVATRYVKRTVHPIRHLLLINFLNDDIDNFFSEIKNIYNPFGKGPWPCLNKASNHYRKNVVKDLTITEDYKTRVPVGTFSCECGFMYSRKGPDKVENDKYKIGRIKNCGSVWEDKLKAYLKEEKYGLRELSRLMNCDPKTILKYDNLFRINYFKSNSSVIKYEEKASDGDIKEKYKEIILNTIESNKVATRTEIRNMCKKEYIYLYRNDKKWLKYNLPVKTRIINHNKVVDWSKRDIEILALIKSKYKEMSNSDVPIRIMKSSIGKTLGILATLEKNLNKLPNTEKYLNGIVETVEEFQIRRCKKIIDIKFENSENIKLWEIQKIAGIRNRDFKKIKNNVLDYIDLKTNGGNYEQSSS